MSSPIGRIGRAFRNLFRPSGQRPVRAPASTPPKTPAGQAAPTMPSGQEPTGYRVGVNPHQKGSVSKATGERFLTGRLPSKAGVATALGRIPSDHTKVTVYGKPAPGVVSNTSPVDKLGNVYRSAFVPTVELEQELLQANTMEDFTYAALGLDFEQTLTVYVEPA